jgi:hypothetical protein
MAEADLGEQVAFLEGAFAEMRERLRTLEWLVGFSMAWNTLIALEMKNDFNTPRGA